MNSVEVQSTAHIACGGAFDCGQVRSGPGEGDPAGADIAGRVQAACGVLMLWLELPLVISIRRLAGAITGTVRVSTPWS